MSSRGHLGKSFQDSQRDILERISGDASLAGVLEEIVLAVEQQGEGMLCSILLLDRDRNTLKLGAAPSLPTAYSRAIDGESIGPQAGSCGTAAYRRERVIVADIATHPLLGELQACRPAPRSPGLLVKSDLFLEPRGSWNICNVLPRSSRPPGRGGRAGECSDASRGHRHFPRSGGTNPQEERSPRKPPRATLRGSQQHQRSHRTHTNASG